MTSSTLVAIAALTLAAGVSMYAVFAGADFGGGVWDLVAGGPRKEEQRSAIRRAMGPVWEANHIWVIFLIVVLFTAFPKGFMALSIGLFVPLSLVVLGVVLRGAAFVFRAHDEGAPREQRLFEVVFSIASLVTPFALGAAAAMVADGALTQGADGEWHAVAWSAFLSPFPIAIGLLAVCICAYTAATFLMAQTSGPLCEDFRRRALVAGGAFAALSVIGLVLADREAPTLAHELLHGRGLPFVIAAAVLAVLGLAVTLRGGHTRARYVSVAFVLAVVWGWGAAQWPYIVTPTLTFQEAASSDAMLEVYLVCLAAGAVLLVPSLLYLWRTFGGQLPASESHEP
ncbi:MAG: cytochrome d ubiquinol oxidase subunit II [Gaiellales bacterium]